MTELRNWLLERAHEMMIREGSEDAAHDFDHLVRVIVIAETIQKREGGDLPTIWAAVAFHDIGQERERQHGGDHALISAEMAADALSNTSFPKYSMAAITRRSIHPYPLISLNPLILSPSDVYAGLQITHRVLSFSYSSRICPHE